MCGAGPNHTTVAGSVFSLAKVGFFGCRSFGGTHSIEKKIAWAPQGARGSIFRGAVYCGYMGCHVCQANRVSGRCQCSTGPTAQKQGIQVGRRHASIFLLLHVHPSIFPRLTRRHACNSSDTSFQTTAQQKTISQKPNRQNPRSPNRPGTLILLLPLRLACIGRAYSSAQEERNPRETALPATMVGGPRRRRDFFRLGP